LNKENELFEDLTFDSIDELNVENVTEETMEEVSLHLSTLNKVYIRQYNANSDQKDAIIRERQSTEEDKKAFNQLRDEYENESLSDLVTNKTEFNQISEYDGELIQRADPVYNIPRGNGSHFYTPVKKFFGQVYSTKTANVAVLWFMSILLMISLYFDLFLKLLNLFGNINLFKSKEF